ncbi:hypothetical protein CPS_3535 [Colwellia psychrerythraea 34H]|uniref:Uncharacterized protein n=1 Tax=Colwellia psychrerythraea (strain 34H / ATCC BAA-681) TaxID=167879 RepID=Q47YB1_COLP3|nr:hypothetical protein CPS_3535 [Colwellia psychrerythraea 34H]
MKKDYFHCSTVNFNSIEQFFIGKIAPSYSNNFVYQ